MKKTILALLCIIAFAFAGCNKDETKTEPNVSKQNVDTDITKATDANKSKSSDELPAISDADSVGVTAGPTDVSAILKDRSLAKPGTGTRLVITSGVEPIDVLNEVVNTYKSAKSYGDHGRFVMQLERVAEPVSWPCTFAYVAPNFVRMEISQGQLVSDGKNLYAQIPPIDGQILKLSAPNNISIPSVYPDPYLAAAMDLQVSGEIFWIPPQLLLLFAENPLKTLCPENVKLSFDDPVWLGDSPCDRIKVDAPSGESVYWIDRNTYAVLRIDLPVDEIEPQNGRQVLSLHLDLSDAVINYGIGGDAFTLAYPSDALIMDRFVPWPIYLTGKKPDGFDALNIKSLAGQEIPLSNYFNRVMVLLFWSTEGEPSEAALKELYPVYKSLEKDQRVRFIAVCMDGNMVSNEDITQKLADFETVLPTCRISDTDFAETLHLEMFPTLVIVAPDGIIARYFQGGIVNTSEEISEAIEKVLQGETNEAELSESITVQRDEFKEMVRQFVESDYYALPSSDDDEIWSRPEIIEQKMPVNLQFTKAFTCNSLRGPGNVLVIPSQDNSASPEFLVPYEQNMLALVDVDGNVKRNIRLDQVLTDESITFVRTALNSQGKRIYAASSLSRLGGNRVHLLDENFRTLGFYPQMKAEADETIISDVRLADIDGDKEPEIIVSILDAPDSVDGKGSIRVLKMDMTELWRNDNTSAPYQVGVAYSGKSPTIITMNVLAESSELVELDVQGRIKRPIALKKEGNQIGWFAVDDLEGNGNSRICVIVPDSQERGNMHIAEMDMSGNQLWEYPFPGAHHAVPVEQIIATDVVGDSTKEWILASPDGVLHILDYQGKLLDRYAHGKTVTGFTGATFGGKKHLLVSDPETITAYEVR